MDTPYYLTPNSGNQGDVLFNIPIYSAPNPQGPVQTSGMLESVWTSVAETSKSLVGDASDYVFDTVSNTWVSVKDAVKDTITEGLEGVQGVFDWAKYQILFIVGGLLIVVWVVAKSGILTQASGFLK